MTKIHTDTLILFIIFLLEMAKNSVPVRAGVVPTAVRERAVSYGRD